MTVTSILGSPRKKGNTNRVLSWVEDELGRLNHRVSRIDVVDHKVNGCKGCSTCQTSENRPGCPQKDDVANILSRLIDSDVVLYASPNYMWGLSSQLKALVDRHCCLVTGFGTPDWQSLLDGKRAALVVTCGDAIENNCDLMMQTFERFAAYLKIDYLGALVIPYATTPDAMGEDVRDQAKAFARKIAASG
jgi:multimeric flavodoxin WrbA